MSKDRTWNRRDVLESTAAAALLIPVAGCAEGELQPIGQAGDSDSDSDAQHEVGVPFDASAIDRDDDLFPSTVQAGAMQKDSFLMVSRVSDEEPVVLKVWSAGSEDGLVVFEYDESVIPEDGGFVNARVTGLEAGQWYAYALFVVDDDGTPLARSWIGKVRTAIPDDAMEPLVLALTACNGNGDAEALYKTAEQDYDIFLHLGDMAYNDGARSQSDYRASWRSYLEKKGFKRAFANSGLYATWDDHEFDNGWDPESYTHIDEAKDAFFETVAADRGSEGQLWTSYRWGLTAEIILLDCRSERLPSTRLTDDAKYISDAQMDFLLDRLRNSPCHFKVVMNSVPITDMPGIWDAAAYDRWEGYAAQRNQLLDVIDEEDIENVWFLSGDFHVCFAGRVRREGSQRTSRTWEVAVTGGNVNPLGAALPKAQFPYGTAQPRATIIRLDPNDNRVLVRFINPNTGEVDEAYLDQTD
jgi:phosphodiesterase/alkaline phosphatase D-like protein